MSEPPDREDGRRGEEGGQLPVRPGQDRGCVMEWRKASGCGANGPCVEDIRDGRQDLSR